MSLSELARSLLRRWYLVVTGILVTVGLCAVVFEAVPPIHESTASVILVPGPGMITEGGNPLLYLGGLTQARDVLVRTLGAEEVRKPITDAYPDAEISLGSDPTTTGPMILVSVESSSVDSARSTLAALLDAVPTTLDRLQDEAKAPHTARASVLVLARDSEPTLSRKDQIKFTGAAGVIGLVSTILLTGLVDGLVGQRGRRLATTDVPAERPGDRAPSTLDNRALTVPAPSSGTRDSSRS